jgi:soluble lytic murein transglycosylase-like protein
MFLDRERIARIEREQPSSGETAWREGGWSSGNAHIDHLIKVNASRFGVDPYLVFCVIEQESQFKQYARSPKGAQGLMQLMPGTARRLGVRRPYDPAENIMGGTRYLKELMTMFGGKVELVLASYNAGEGAVMKYGRKVPPYRETREYVKKIGKRYGIDGRKAADEADMPSPQK